ncbi:MAG: GWxTD domain-containing protein [Candidatus Eisenbacteria bacterium]|uniref:GWxTD domain-containing protein n=1 Tax=Eiseniibacteriota bacterium TaxID=2212470 RepID=A0A849SGU8_UNCEI|nr:GWxTD domain-containing protein [Candidatus Eisenbacteria bacterium]
MFKFTVLLVLLLVVAGPATPARGASTGPSKPEQAQGLYELARADIALGKLPTRRRAMQRLERAARLDPARADIELELARLYQDMGFLKQARRRFQDLADRNPADLPARRGLAALWRRDYLKYLDTTSLDRALDHLAIVVRTDSTDADSWIVLSTLQIERGRADAARRSADAALRVAPRRADALLAAAQSAYRCGSAELADSLFELAIPRLVTSARSRFEDIAPLASAEDTMRMRALAPSLREDFRRRFWVDQDPDPTTTHNEAQLEYWSRVAQAYFIYFDHRRREWDQRGEVYVRYGAPARAIYNPVGSSNLLTIRDAGVSRTNGLFPVNSLRWEYPELGLSVTLEDRLLSEYYLNPIALHRDTDPAPDPDSLAAHPEQFGTAGGRGVFRVLPPGVRPLPVDAVVARFEGAERPRLMTLMSSPGTPADRAIATYVVFDSTRREVARASRALSPSACDPATLRDADFASELPPGEYSVAISVADGPAARGVRRETVKLVAADSTLSVSDVVVSCGPPQFDGARGVAPSVRLAANPSRRVPSGDPLVVYFEIYHLRPGRDGMSEVEVEYAVRSIERDRRVWIQRVLSPARRPPELLATRRESQRGEVRRQFVSVPLEELPAGRYRIDITVRDLVAGRAAVSGGEFVRTAP